MAVADGSLIFRNLSMAEFADRLSARPLKVDRPVVDKTGLKGTFDLTLKLASDNASLKHALEGFEQDSSVFTVIQEFLGLKLEPEKGPVEILVIDHAEKVPTEN
jgi:uncharacterized protein (TIGR03435 family)